MRKFIISDGGTTFVKSEGLGGVGIEDATEVADGGSAIIAVEGWGGLKGEGWGGD